MYSMIIHSIAYDQIFHSIFVFCAWFSILFQFCKIMNYEVPLRKQFEML